MLHLKLQDIMELRVNLSLYFVSMVIKFWDKSDQIKKDSHKNLTKWLNWDSKLTLIFSPKTRSGSPMVLASKDTTCQFLNLSTPETLVICDNQ